MWCFVARAGSRADIATCEEVIVGLGTRAFGTGICAIIGTGICAIIGTGICAIIALDLDVYVLEFCAQCNIFGHRVYLCFLWVVCVLHTG